MRINHCKLRASLEEREIQVCKLALASEIPASSLSAIINGYERIGIIRTARLKEGLKKLGIPAEEISSVFGDKRASPQSSA